MRVGLASDYGGSYLLPRLVGMARAKELYLTGKMIDAKEAERIGMINRVVPDAELEKTVYALARQFAMVRRGRWDNQIAIERRRGKRPGRCPGD